MHGRNWRNVDRKHGSLNRCFERTLLPWQRHAARAAFALATSCLLMPPIVLRGVGCLLGLSLVPAALEAALRLWLAVRRASTCSTLTLASRPGALPAAPPSSRRAWSTSCLVHVVRSSRRRSSEWWFLECCRHPLPSRPVSSQVSSSAGLALGRSRRGHLEARIQKHELLRPSVLRAGRGRGGSRSSAVG